MKAPPSKLSNDELQKQRESIRRGLLRANTAAVLILLLVIGLALAAILQAEQAVRERTRAVQAEQDAREKLWKSYEGEARGSRASPLAGHRFESLDALKSAASIRPSLELRNDAIASLTLADLRLVRSWPTSPSNSMTFDATFERYATADGHGHIRICRRADDQLLLELSALTNAAQFVFRFSPDGQLLPVAYQDGYTRIWDLNRREVVRTFRVSEFFQTLDFSADSRRLVVAEAEGSIKLHDLSAAATSFPLPVPSELSRPLVRLSPDGRALAVFSESSTVVSILDVATRRETARLVHQQVVRGLAWHPDGELLATGCQDQNAYLWNPCSPSKPIRTFVGHQSSLVEVCFHPNGQILASDSWDGTTRLWDVATGQELARMVGGGQDVRFSRDGRFFAFHRDSGGTSSFNLCEVADARAVRFLNESDANSPQASEPKPGWWWTGFSSDERYLGAAGRHGVRVWDLQRSAEPTRLSTNEALSVFFHPDGRHLIASGRDGLQRWSYESAPGGDGLRFSAQEKLFTQGCEHAGVSRDGAVLVFASAGSVYLLGSTQSFQGWPGDHWVVVSPDGRWVAASAWAFPGVRLWETTTGTLAREFPTRGPGYVAFSPDGRWLATGAQDEDCLWNIKNPGIVRRLPRPDTPEFHGTFAFSPDQRLFARARSFTQIQLLDARTLEEVARLESPAPQLIAALEFSPSSQLLAVATETAFIQVWDLRWLRQQLAPLGLDWSSDHGEVTASGVERESLGAGTLHAAPFAVTKSSIGSWRGPFLVYTLAGVALAVFLAFSVLNRQRKLVQSYRQVDELAMERSRDLDVAQAELIQSQKMKALGTLAAGIAHDFNNLLSVIRLSNDVIGQDAGNKPSVREEVQSIENAVQQGRAVVRSMLGYSREAADKPCSYSVGDVLADSVGLLSKQFLSGVVLTIDVDRATPQVWGAPSRLEQMLLNLIVNAAEAMKGRGRLLITVKSKLLSPAESLSLRPRPAANYAEVSITDSGPGIAPQTLPRIFEPFFTTKTVGTSPGTGLGLSTVYTIAREDGVGLAVETKVGQGTTFRILIPEQGGLQSPIADESSKNLNSEFRT
jgi:signal transduction histidine kinase